MAHGGPDWGIGVPVSTIYGVDDLGELAVRLGSINSFDRRGNVVFLSSFEDSLNPFLRFSSGANADVSISNTSSRNGACSCELRPGDAVDDDAYIRHYSPFPVSSKVGVEISFATVHSDVVFAVQSWLDDGVVGHWPIIEYRWNTDQLVYYDEGGVEHVFASNLKLHTYERIYHTMKVVVDIAKREFVRVILNDIEYNLEGTKYEMAATTGSKQWYQLIGAQAKVTLGTWVYIDDLIVTQNEP